MAQPRPSYEWIGTKGRPVTENLHVCVDQLLDPPPQTPTERMALVKGSKWPLGSQIRVKFLGGTPVVRAKVKEYALQWMQYARVTLTFVEDGNAHVRISFVKGGSSSRIGTDCKKIPADQATMNYGWLTDTTAEDEFSRVILHEFGHALGCIHEHQHPEAGIHWNKPNVYAYYAKPPNSWTKEKTDYNIFATYDKDLTVATKTLDPASIMLYAIPPEFTTDGFTVGWNRVLSEIDQKFIAKMYPK
jgi:serralysin